MGLHELARNARCRALSTYLLLGAAYFTFAPAGADWQGDIEAGTQIRDGNAATRLRGTLFEDSRPFTQTLYAEWVRDSADGDEYRIGYLPRYWLASRIYALGETRLRVDEPLGVDSEIRALIGVGAELIVRRDAALNLETGVGAVATRFDADIDDDRSGYLMARGYGYRVFAERFRIDAGADVERSERVTDLHAEIGVALSIATGSIRYAVQTRRIDIDETGSASSTRGYLSFGYRF